LIKALPAIVHEVPNIEVVIVAGGPSEMELQKLVQELNLANTVKFFPAVSHDLIPSYLKEFDLFVIPSITEAFGVVAIEAQAMGIPVVGTRVG